MADKMHMKGRPEHSWKEAIYTCYCVEQLLAKFMLILWSHSLIVHELIYPREHAQYSLGSAPNIELLIASLSLNIAGFSIPGISPE